MNILVQHINHISIGIGIFIFFMLNLTALVSYRERERKAVKVAIFLSVILPLPYLLLNPLLFPFSSWFSIFLVFSTMIFTIIILLPIQHKTYEVPAVPDLQIDERNIMFSRKALTPGELNFQAYYQKHPEHLSKDNLFRQEPGLLSNKSAYYDPVTFAATHATFFTVEQFQNAVDGEMANEKQEISPEKISRFIKNWCQKLGAVDTGMTRLQKYHLYSYGGRTFNYGQKIINNHTYAIAFTVEMDREMLAAAPAGPTVMESAQQYLNAGNIAVQVAAFIRHLGYAAKAHIDGKYDVICPLVARDAGLGEIGRMGLLMTPRLGPRVRIGVVTTNIPLITDPNSFDGSVIDFCTICKKCAEVCPSRAISFDDRKEINGSKRWQINQEACYTFWTKAGTDCGRCVSVCPYSHPDNLLHNIVRQGIKNSSIFRRLALKMDDVFYDKKPLSTSFPEWLHMK